MTNLYYGTVKQLLERISSVMIDREAIQQLVGLVKEALKNGPIISELGTYYVGSFIPILFILIYFTKKIPIKVWTHPLLENGG